MPEQSEFNQRPLRILGEGYAENNFLNAILVQIFGHLFFPCRLDD